VSLELLFGRFLTEFRGSAQYAGVKFKKNFLLEEVLNIKTSSTSEIDKWFAPELLQDSSKALAWVESKGVTNDSLFRNMKSSRFKDYLKGDHSVVHKSTKAAEGFSRGKVRRRRSSSGSRDEGSSRKYRKSTPASSDDEQRARSGRKGGRKERLRSESLD
jgi:hypothetical protein